MPNYAAEMDIEKAIPGTEVWSYNRIEFTRQNIHKPVNRTKRMREKEQKNKRRKQKKGEGQPRGDRRGKRYLGKQRQAKIKHCSATWQRSLWCETQRKKIWWPLTGKAQKDVVGALLPSALRCSHLREGPLVLWHS